MLKTKISPVLLFLGTVLSCGSFVCALPLTISDDTQATSQEIYVDQNCRILQTTPSVAAKALATKGSPKAHWRRDYAECHLESVAHSDHPEERISGGMRQRGWSSISEQEYLLQDVTNQPVIFVVQEFVPHGWQVDSDPRPDESVASTGKEGGQVAVFRVVAQPGQSVRLHVGLRHTTMGKPKPIKRASGSST